MNPFRSRVPLPRGALSLSRIPRGSLSPDLGPEKKAPPPPLDGTRSAREGVCFDLWGALNPVLVLGAPAGVNRWGPRQPLSTIFNIMLDAQIGEPDDDTDSSAGDHPLPAW